MRRAAALLLVLAGLTGDRLLAADAEAFASAARDWRAWAVAALENPPAGIEDFPELAARLERLISERRAQAGQDLDPLEHDDGLRRAALAHAYDMLRRDFMAHESPGGLAAGERVGLLARRFAGLAGENLAEHEGLSQDQLAAQLGPLALKLADGFMASPGHRDNILRPDYTHQALAAASQDERLVVVHVFGGREALLAEPLPFEVESGARIALDFAAARGGKTPAGFAFQAPGQPVEELVVLELSSSEVVVDPGLWRLEFMLPTGEEGRFQVADGPFIDVR